MENRRLFDETVSSMYETVLNPAHWDVAIRHIAALFQAPTAAMFRYDVHTKAPSDFRIVGHDPEVERLYSSYYHTLDPGRFPAIHSAVGEWLSDESMLDTQSRLHQEYVQDFALRCGIGRVAGCKVTGDGASILYLSLQRRPGAERFGESARHLYRTLEPHLRRAIEMRTRMANLAAQNALTRNCLDRLNVGVLVVDKSRQVHLVNAWGLRLMEGGTELSITNQRLTCARPSLNEQLNRLVACACLRPARGGALRLASEGNHAGVLLLIILPIPQSHDLAGVFVEPLAVVVVSDTKSAANQAALYRSLFALTNAEADLMTAIVDGTSVIDWAKKQRISVNTVRTQLRSVFEKTGMDTQARLVGLAKSVPPFG